MVEHAHVRYKINIYPSYECPLMIYLSSTNKTLHMDFKKRQYFGALQSCHLLTMIIKHLIM